MLLRFDAADYLRYFHDALLLIYADILPLAIMPRVYFIIACRHDAFFAADFADYYADYFRFALISPAACRYFDAEPLLRYLMPPLMLLQRYAFR